VSRLRTLALAVILCGCAPTTSSLVASRNFNEAVCSVDGSSPPADRQALIDELDRALEPAVHVHAVTRQELEAVAGADAAGAVLGRTVLLNLVSQANRAPLEQLSIRMAVLTRDKALRPLVEREQLAAIFGEVLPATSGPAGTPEERRAAGLQDMVGVTARLVSLGVLRPKLSDRPRRGEGSDEPTPEDYFEAAPKTETVHRNLGEKVGCGQPGSLCRNLHAFVRPPDKTVPTRLSFVVSYAASGRDGRLDGCQVSEEIEVALPAGHTLEERIARVFANRTVRLRDLSSMGR
jgi:hypothetical protein